MTVVAIDGPAGSGKSTVAAALALRLGVPHVDTGAIYRAATLAVLRAGVDVRDEAACLRVVERASILRADGRTRLDGEDVEALIRGPEVTAAVSAVSEHPAVRAALLGLQRAQVGDAGGVVEGRDAGTVVVPDARLKVWLTANPLERARRRAAERGETDPEAVAAQAADLERRDAHDAAQMRRAPDAVEIDTTGRGIEDLVDELASMVEARA
ncbi:MAG TPA: (d)CMP kinase [Egibacteraceae bacterium]|nr:(d)CMP kinase [Egibacteraceae bacterium]